MGTLENVFQLLVEPLALAAEFAGAATITVTVGYTVLPYLQLIRPASRLPLLSDIRRRLGRGLVLGLEFLIGGAMLRAALMPTLAEVTILGVLILLRTVLALSIAYELRGTERVQPELAPVAHEPGPSRAAWGSNGRAV